MSLAGRAGWNEPLDVGAFPVVEVPRQEPPRAADGGPVPGAHEEGDELPAFDREKSGVIRATVANAVMAMRRPDLVGLRIGHDDPGAGDDATVVAVMRQGEVLELIEIRIVTSPLLPTAAQEKPAPSKKPKPYYRRGRWE